MSVHRRENVPTFIKIGCLSDTQKLLKPVTVRVKVKEPNSYYEPPLYSEAPNYDLKEGKDRRG